ncbi:hypothetical protein ED733_002002 [Metarhizium rileyi]|uniref:Cryptochrome DASH n=1 Tax=Metarhizium rileyi (strain RCEF 4871) TaxID=1649241 RepID=A0A5C6GEJ5_METRR|nr:hypothetical protein ED733_002002 [Metarhizium rileyi]
MSRGRLLVYLLRRDLRVSDNPVLHHLVTTSDHGFTHLLPVYVFPANQVEVSGFLKDGEQSPYPPARSQVGKFWRCGPHRAKFTAETVWDMKKNLEDLGSGLLIRIGTAKDVVNHLIQEMKETVTSVGGVWMTEEPSWEEAQEQESISLLCSEKEIEFKLWKDEKYFIDDRDNGLESPEGLPDVFTTYRKSQEPLREKPRKVLSKPGESSLPAMPQNGFIPAQAHPFVSPSSLEDLQKRLAKPLQNMMCNPPHRPENATDGHPFSGGETSAWERLRHSAKSGALTSYKETRNGLVGTDYSTKLSGYLALGCLTARQIHEELLKLEDGTDEQYKDAVGYGEGENDGTKGIRFELLWRDYMRLCTAKFGRKLFRLSGFRQQDGSYNKKWKTATEKIADPEQDPPPSQISKILERFQNGTTGMGLVDASQRELYHTGYTSNRARQNVASFLSKHLQIDWRYGAEWYEMMLTDYDVSSNWANWQYVAGVGNDPRGDARTFNPIKQAFDYDIEGTFVRMWMAELQGLDKLENVFQVCTTEAAELESCGLSENIMVTDPVKKIEFYVDRKPRATRRVYNKRRGHPRGGRWLGNSKNQYHSGSGMSSEAAANESTSTLGVDAETRDRDRKAREAQQFHDTTWRGNYTGGLPMNMHVHGGRGWQGGDQSRGRGNVGHYSGSWRPHGQRGGFRGRYPFIPQMPYAQFPGGAQ